MMSNFKVDPFLWKNEVNPKKLELLDDWTNGNEVLDLGCGPGLYSKYLDSKGLSVTAIDQEDMIEGKSGINFLSQKVPPIPLPKNSCDTVLMFDLLEHVEREDELLSEIKRVTRQRIILSVPSDNDGVLPKFGLAHVHHVDKTHKREYNPRKLENILKKHNFQIKHIEPQTPRSVPLVAAAFFTEGTIGKVLRFLTVLWLKFLRKVGVIQINLPADWFLVADLVD